MELTSFDKQILNEINSQISDAHVYEHLVNILGDYTLVEIDTRRGEKLYYVYAGADVEYVGTTIDILTKYNFEYLGDTKVGNLVTSHMFRAPKEKTSSLKEETKITKSDKRMLKEIARQVGGKYIERRPIGTVDRVVLKDSILVAIDFSSFGEGKFYYINIDLDPEAVGVAIDIFTERGLEYLKDVGAWYKFVNIEGV